MVTSELPITIILSFLNTLNLLSGHDVFRDPAMMSAWLRQRGVTEEPSLHDVSLAMEVREAVRDLLLSPAGEGSRASLEVLTRAAGSIRLGMQHEAGTVAFRPAGDGVERAIAELLLSVHTAMADGRWQRIGICRNPECRWAFFDRSRNRTRVWCAMTECGNKMKARRFRQRRGLALDARPASLGPLGQ
jgi:predicted RNA-binding Zn ribbon-like protein